MAPEIASWDPENSLGRTEAHPGRALALPAPRKAPESVRAAAYRTPPGEGPGGSGDTFDTQPTSPQALESSSPTRGSLSPRPRTPDGVSGYREEGKL